MSHTQTKYWRKFWEPINQYIDELASKPFSDEELSLPESMQQTIARQRNAIIPSKPFKLDLKSIFNPQPVLGLKFKFKGSMCYISRLASNSFFYEEVGSKPKKNRYISYTYWTSNVIEEFKNGKSIIKLKFKL